MSHSFLVWGIGAGTSYSNGIGGRLSGSARGGCLGFGSGSGTGSGSGWGVDVSFALMFGSSGSGLMMSFGCKFWSPLGFSAFSSSDLSGCGSGCWWGSSILSPFSAVILLREPE